MSPGSAGTAGSSAAAVSSRFWRALSLRHSSTRRREATVESQACGLSGTPCSGHCSAAATQGLLDGILAGVELPVAADETAEDPRRKLAQQVLDGGLGLHTSGGPSATRRTSIGDSVKATISAAISSARASSATSTIQ